MHFSSSPASPTTQEQLPRANTEDADGSFPVSGADTAWVLLCFVLVLSMYPGLALFEAGLLRAKNTVSILVQVVVGLTTLSVLWDLVGFTLDPERLDDGYDEPGTAHTFTIRRTPDDPLDTCTSAVVIRGAQLRY